MAVVFGEKENREKSFTLHGCILRVLAARIPRGFWGVPGLAVVPRPGTSAIVRSAAESNHRGLRAPRRSSQDASLTCPRGRRSKRLKNCTDIFPSIVPDPSFCGITATTFSLMYSTPGIDYPCCYYFFKNMDSCNRVQKFRIIVDRFRGCAFTRAKKKIPFLRVISSPILHPPRRSPIS